MDRDHAGGADERRRIRARLLQLGLADHQLLEPLAVELRQRGVRPRTAWRHANGLTQAEVAEQYNTLTNRESMRASRISEYEAWPSIPGTGRPRGVRPLVPVLRRLAAIYHTTWDQLVDFADLEQMPEADRQEYRAAVLHRAGRCEAPPPTDLPTEVPDVTGRTDAKGPRRPGARL
jgi:hypothetical protein